MWVVHGMDGMDELTISGPSFVACYNLGELTSFEVTPEDANLKQRNIEDLRGGDAVTNSKEILALLNGKQSAYQDIVVLNTAAQRRTRRHRSLRRVRRYRRDSSDCDPRERFIVVFFLTVPNDGSSSVQGHSRFTGDLIVAGRDVVSYACSHEELLAYAELESVRSRD